jgi:spermidine/putrescine transport system ATP-binding protein
MSDRMAVMNDGLVQQLGTPRDVYEEPATTFVADFLGVSNLMPARAEGGGRVRLSDAALSAGRGDVEARGDVRVTIRPERVRVEAAGTEGENRLRGTVSRVVYLGSTTQILLELAGGQTLQATASAADGLPPGEGEAVTVHLPPDALRVLAESD